MRHKTTSQHLWWYEKSIYVCVWAALTGQVCPCHWFVLHWTSRSSSTASPQEGTAGLPSRPESPTNRHTHYTPEHYNKHTSDILSTHTHLAVLSVDQLICEYVLRKESVRQRFTLILDHRELRQTARRIWHTHTHSNSLCHILRIQLRIHFHFTISCIEKDRLSYPKTADTGEPGRWCRIVPHLVDAPPPGPFHWSVPPPSAQALIFTKRWRVSIKLTTANH